jgi:predicted signal transduction protein with EAL and GGDEF domain
VLFSRRSHTEKPNVAFQASWRGGRSVDRGRNAGAGYSSLSYLQRFPFDKIKIDRCFVNDIAEPGGSSCIVQAVVNIAAERHMTTTAEGVETQQQQQLLRALGCSEMQGYLFSRPKPAAEVRQLLFAHRQRSAAVALIPARKRRQIPGTAKA